MTQKSFLESEIMNKAKNGVSIPNVYVTSQPINMKNAIYREASFLLPNGFYGYYFLLLITYNNCNNSYTTHNYLYYKKTKPPFPRY